MDFTKRVELEVYLLQYPAVQDDIDKVNAALLQYKGDKIGRTEFLLELVIGHLEEVQRQIDDAKIEFGIEDGIENA